MLRQQAPYRLRIAIFLSSFLNPPWGDSTGAGIPVLKAIGNALMELCKDTVPPNVIPMIPRVRIHSARGAVPRDGATSQMYKRMSGAGCLVSDLCC